ncbi:major strawberry allergen Fra a 1.08-like [Eucalyptus grandis]|uniref:major strawberry allergen Fra a 1.08-like n=1 Tax=Eucalyptus grandis TaxID=71139 RepID=UPI00192E9FC4|nr:major strawberry allergen Fra a 1.08-like [Eucalyptus grandis]
MVEVTLKAEITHPIPKAKLVEAFLEAKGFFPHTLLPAIKNADIQETISVEGRQRRTVRHTVKAPDQEPFLYNHSTVDRDEQGRISKETSHEVKIVALPLEGGSVCKYAGRCFTVGQGDITEEEMIGAMREKASVMFKAILDYPEAKSMKPSKPSLDYPTAYWPSSPDPVIAPPRRYL